MKAHPYVDDEVAKAVADGAELWRSIPGLEGRYEVSTMGRLRSVQRFVPYGYRPRKIRGRVVALQKSKYLSVNCLGSDGRSRRYAVHRLVALVFLKRDTDRTTVNHENGHKHDNRASNLRWATMAEQNTHSRRVLRKCVGEKNPRAKLTQDAVDEIRALRSFGAKIIDLAKLYKVDRQAVRHVVSGKFWKTVAA